MKTARWLAAASVVFAAGAFAQSAPPTNAPPPPGINDPGVKAVEPARKAVAQPATPADTPAAERSTLDLKPQALPAMQDDGAAQERRDTSLPQIRVRQEGENSIQEYSRNGRVYMVVVTPKSGISQTYMVDPQGRLVDEHGQKPVRPVMYKVMEWGKSPAPAESASEAASTDSN